MNSLSPVILFADDDVDDFELLQEGLLKVVPQHTLHYISHGDKVFAAVKEYFPDLIFLDYNMPGADGMECLDLLKADPEVHNIPVVMYSTSSAASSLKRCFELGAARYLLKPVDYAGIFKGLELIIHLYQSGRLVRPDFDHFVIDTYKL